MVVAALLSVAVVSWFATASEATSMGSMVSGLSQIGTSMPSAIGAPLFMAMWLTMMTAMMLPTVLPMVLTYRLVTLRRGEGWMPLVCFVGGYLVVWTLIGLVPLAAFLGVRDLTFHSVLGPWLPAISGAILIVAGLYQFTPIKAVCLRSCRGPLDFIMSHDFGGGWRSGFTAGLTHGAYCLGCCWALMSLLIVVGLMNLVWMAALSLVFFAEKNWRFGVRINRFVGVAVAFVGVAILVHPHLLSFLSGGQPPAAPGGHM